jgi:outer membrane lipoprotein-sorting protein
MIFALSFTFNFGKTNIVYAMEQAFQNVKAYHGILEIAETNAEGKQSVQAKVEVWADKNGHYYLKEIGGSQAGLITINNGQKKWQVRPDQKQVNVFSAFPDPYRFTFELGSEVKDAKNALSTKVIGEEQVSGRKATVLEVTPQGGVAYKLWIDKETNLPLKKQSAMQNALQYTVTYVDISYSDAIPEELMAYKLPAGFKEVSINAEQLVNSLEEAKEIAGFTPRTLENIPAGYINDGIAVDLNTKIIKLYYADKEKQTRIVFLQGKAAGEFKPDSRAIQGKIGSSIAEVQSPIQADSGILAGGGLYAGVTGITSIRWQDGGYEYAVVGDASVEDLSLFAKEISKADLKLPSQADISSAKPAVEVPVDMAVEENEQKSVDAGHSPWKLDPVFVSQVFVSLKISPQGIVGDYPIKYENLKVAQNTGTDAVIEVHDSKSPISKVYLKKLVRQDNTGIWTLVGYDPADKK